MNAGGRASMSGPGASTQKGLKPLGSLAVLQAVKTLLTWALALACATEAARLSWALYPRPPLAPLEPVAPASFADAAQRPDLANLRQAGLFGDPRQEVAESPRQEPPKAPSEPEVVTRLPVRLLGVIKGESGDFSVAVLEERGRQRAYRVGDFLHLDEGARVLVIESDRVVLDVNGQRQYVELEQAGAEIGNQGVTREPTAAPARGDTSVLPERIDLGRPELRARLGNVRRKLVDDPLSFGRYIQLRPYAEEGRLQGYRLQPGRDGRLFQQLGLRAGDVVTQVGGLAVTDPDNLGRLLEMVKQQSRISIGIRRDGSLQEIDVEL